jgi:hypothetical protein
MINVTIKTSHNRPTFNGLRMSLFSPIKNKSNFFTDKHQS